MLQWLLPSHSLYRLCALVGVGALAVEVETTCLTSVFG